MKVVVIFMWIVATVVASGGGWFVKKIICAHGSSLFLKDLFHGDIRFTIRGVFLPGK